MKCLCISIIHIHAMHVTMRVIVSHNESLVLQRERNSSGASIQSSRLFQPRSESPVMMQYVEESWHEDMRNNFVKCYIDYLRQTQQPVEELGFMTIKRKPVKRGSVSVCIPIIQTYL